MSFEKVSKRLRRGLRMNLNGRVFGHASEDGIHQFDDCGARPVRTFERFLDELHFALTGDRLQLLEDSRITAPPSVDRLFHVANHKERATPVGHTGDFRGDRAHGPPLSRRGVLKLIQQQMLNPSIDPIPEFFQCSRTHPTAERIKRLREVVKLRKPTMPFDRGSPRPDSHEQFVDAGGALREVAEISCFGVVAKLGEDFHHRRRKVFFVIRAAGDRDLHERGAADLDPTRTVVLKDGGGEMPNLSELVSDSFPEGGQECFVQETIANRGDRVFIPLRRGPCPSIGRRLFMQRQ